MKTNRTAEANGTNVPTPPAGGRGNTDPGAAQRAGDEGEAQALRMILEGIKSHRVDVWHSVRVPNPDWQERGGERDEPNNREPKKFEIDFLVVGPHGIVGIEVKAWSGRLDVGPSGGWLRLERNGAENGVEDQLQYMERKMRAVWRYLKDKCGEKVPKESIHLGVLFTNPNIRLGQSLQNTPGILTPTTLLPWLVPLVDKESPGMWADLLRFLRLRPSTPRTIPEVARLAIRRLPTWDVITTREGSTLKGDLNFFLKREGAPHLTRKEAGAHLEFDGTTRATWTTPSGKRETAKLKPDQSLELKMAGNGDAPAQISLAKIKKIHLGYLNDSYYDPIETAKLGHLPLPSHAVVTPAYLGRQRQLRAVKGLSVLVVALSLGVTLTHSMVTPELPLMTPRIQMDAPTPHSDGGEAQAEVEPEVSPNSPTAGRAAEQGDPGPRPKEATRTPKAEPTPSPAIQKTPGNTSKQAAERAATRQHHQSRQGQGQRQGKSHPQPTRPKDERKGTNRK